MKKNDVRFFTEFKTHGRWWLPGRQNSNVLGELTYSPLEGLSLCLFGDFEPIATIARLNSGLDRYDVILGITETGVPITLYGCHQTQNTIRFGGFPQTVFSIQVLFAGHHFESEDQLKFDSVSVSFSGLNSWFGEIPFDEARPKDTEWRNSKTLTFQRPATVEIKLNDMNAKLEVGGTFSTGGSDWWHRNWGYDSHLTLRPTDIQHWSWFNQKTFDLKNFLALGLGHLTYIERMWFRINGSDEGITCVYHQPHFKHKKNPHALEMLMPFKSIQNIAETVFNTWFDDADLLRPVYDLFFASLYKPDMYVQFHFICLAQAVESYHRRTYAGKYLPEDQFGPIKQNLIDAIPTGIPGNFDAVLNARIGFANEFSLKSRLRELLQELPENLVKKFWDEPKVLIQKICDLRNYLTHYHGDRTKMKELEESVWELAKHLELILYALLLSRLSVPTDQIEKSLIQKYHHLLPANKQGSFFKVSSTAKKDEP